MLLILSVAMAYFLPIHGTNRLVITRTRAAMNQPTPGSAKLNKIETNEIKEQNTPTKISNRCILLLLIFAK